MAGGFGGNAGEGVPAKPILSRFDLGWGLDDTTRLVTLQALTIENLIVRRPDFVRSQNVIRKEPLCARLTNVVLD